MKQSNTRSEDLFDVMTRRLQISLICSLFIIVGGVIWTYRIWTDSNLKFHELYHVKETMQGLRAKLGLQEARKP